MSTKHKIEQLLERQIDLPMDESVIALITEIYDKFQEREAELEQVKNEVNELNEVVSRITAFDFSTKAKQDGSGSVLDLLGLTINMLSEEMESFTLSMEYVNNILYSIPDLVLVLDKDFKISQVNRAAKNFGYEESSLLYQSVDNFFDKRKFTFSKFKELVRESSFQGKEYVFIGDKNKEVPVLVSCSMVMDDEKKGEGYVMVIRDITLTKKKEKELRRAKEAAEAAAEAKARFLSTMSHEIRTPMNAINGIIHILLEDDLKQSQIENLNTLKYSADNLIVLINDVLDMSKIESGKLIFERNHFKLNNFVKNIKKTFQSKFTAKKLDFEVNIESEVPNNLIGDKARLHQVLSNIIGNSYKFTHTGGVKINIGCIKKDQEKVKLKIEVEDTGIGIAHSKLESIFDDFTQIDNSNTRKYGGTGLGLSICKKILELQGGNIQVVSSVGRGSTFTFYITYSHEAEKSTVNDSNKGVKKNQFKGFKGAKVLLVEDNPVNIIVTNQFLKIWDFNVEVAKDGAEAITKISHTDFDIILMDLQMPVMDGFEATRQIRKMSDPNKREVPIIALTASAMIEDKQHVMDVGMNDHVAKPFNPDELFNKMKIQLMWKFGLSKF